MYLVVVRVTRTHAECKSYDDARSAAINAMQAYAAKGYRCRWIDRGLGLIRCSRGDESVDILIVPIDRVLIEDPAA